MNHRADYRRLLSRLGGEFQLDAARRVARTTARDVTTVLVFMTINRANVASLTASLATIPEPHAGLPGLPPDHLREPISIYEAAKRLCLPYETARRHTKKLIDAGLCEAVKGGVIVPAKAILKPELATMAGEAWNATVGFVQEVGRLGVIASRSAQPSPDQFQQVNRLVSAYCLDTACHMASVIGHDPASALILRAVNLANVHHVIHDPEAALSHAGLADVLPDDERRPISVYTLAKDFHLPYETTRRILLRLEAEGLLRRQAGGLIVPLEVVTRPDIVTGILDLVTMTETLLEDLAAVGLTYRPES